MQYAEFLTRVQKNANLASKEEAERITRVVLSTLGEPLYRTARAKLVAQLPKELKDIPFQSQPPENIPMDADTYPVDEFYQRVRARADVSLAMAEQHAKAVMQVVAEAVTPAVINDVLDDLPESYQALLQKAR